MTGIHGEVVLNGGSLWGLRDLGNRLNGFFRDSDACGCDPIIYIGVHGKYIRRIKGCISEVQGRLHIMDI